MVGSGIVVVRKHLPIITMSERSRYMTKDPGVHIGEAPRAGTVHSAAFGPIETEAAMARVTGIGGIFFSAKDPVTLRGWYVKHLGVDVLPWGGAAFRWTDENGEPKGGTTIWSIGAQGEENFPPGQPAFVINYRVDDLATLMQALRDGGCNVLDRTDDGEFGKFGWVIDPEGNKVELWEPPAGM